MTKLGYTVHAAAKKLGVEERTIEGALRSGELGGIALPGRKVFITCEALILWLDTMPAWNHTSGSTGQSGSENRELEAALASVTTTASVLPNA